MPKEKRKRIYAPVCAGSEEIVEALSEYLLNPEKPKEVSLATPVQGKFDAKIILDGKEFKYAFPLDRPVNNILSDTGIVTVDGWTAHSGGRLDYIPLNQFKPAYQTIILKQVARDGQFKFFASDAEYKSGLAEKIRSAIA